MVQKGVLALGGYPRGGWRGGGGRGGLLEVRYAALKILFSLFFIISGKITLAMESSDHRCIERRV